MLHDIILYYILYDTQYILHDMISLTFIMVNSQLEMECVLYIVRLQGQSKI